MKVDQEVQNHFPVRIWVCVSLTFDLNKLLEEITRCIPRVEGEKEGTTGELIEQRLKFRRFLLVLDDIWECSNQDDWKRLLLPLKKSQGNGSLIVVTTRFLAIAQMVKSKTSDLSIELEGLEPEEFQKLFFRFAMLICSVIRAMELVVNAEVVQLIQQVLGAVRLVP